MKGEVFIKPIMHWNAMEFILNRCFRPGSKGMDFRLLFMK